jgi:pyridoxal phosphate enzyme (YggS family)
VSGVADRLVGIRDRIERAGGDPDAVTIVAVTKTFGAEACREAIAAGLVDLGENRAQELLAKAPEVDGARWHFIGRLQTNKVRALAEHVALWESVDRPAAVAEIARRAPGARVLVQVNISAEPQKGGCEPAATAPLVRGARDAGLDVLGLMGIGPEGDPEGARPSFRLLSSLADELGLAVRSMGMTGDLEVAVQEGSTMIRVGSGLFGPRRAANLPPD